MSDHSAELEPVTAEAILQSPILLYEAGRMIEQMGVVGEEKLGRLLYLVFTSRIQDRPLSMMLKGESAGGKSYLVSTVLRLMPPEATRVLADATPQSFMYSRAEDLDHRIIVFYEGPGIAKAEYSVRLLQSEGELRIRVTLKDPSTGRFVVEENELRAHVGFLTTTTTLQIEAQNETRQFSAFVDESEAQTGRILGLTAQRYASPLGLAAPCDIEVWKEAQGQLMPYPVEIPYAPALADLFPRRPMRLRRDFERVLALVETICLLHQRQRPVVERQGTSCLVASIADYHIARILAEEVLVQTVYGVPPQVENLLAVARGLGEKGFTIYDLMASGEQNYDVTYKWLQKAINEGFVEVVDPGGGRRRGSYKLTSKELPPGGILPATETLLETCPQSCAGDVIYDPVTGDSLTLGERFFDILTEREGAASNCYHLRYGRILVHQNIKKSHGLRAGKAGRSEVHIGQENR